MIKAFDRKTINCSRLILCEGTSDEAFFRALVAFHQLQDFSIKNGTDAFDGSRGGISVFGRLLNAIVTWEGFFNLKHIIIAADNDTNPSNNFGQVRQQISSLQIDSYPAVKYGIPDKPREFAIGSPASLSILMIPSAGEAGNLETLCLPAAIANNSHIDGCSNAFIECSGASEWSDRTKIDKLKLKLMISAQSPKNPGIGTGHIWKDAEGAVPLNHDCFSSIVEYLRTI